MKLLAIVMSADSEPAIYTRLTTATLLVNYCYLVSPMTNKVAVVNLVYIAGSESADITIASSFIVTNLEGDTSIV
jgi:hypothetical protein